MPKVSYVKAIDVWLNGCLIFVVLALVEFAIVNVLQRRPGAYRTTDKWRKQINMMERARNPKV